MNDILPKSQSSVHDSIVRDLSTFYTEVKSDTTKLLEQKEDKEAFQAIQSMRQLEYHKVNM